MRALARLSWASKQTVKPEDFQLPNELLALGYFEDMSIGVSIPQIGKCRSTQLTNSAVS